MFRTFIVGSVLGFFGTGALLYFVPVVDLHRVPSQISVQTNGGNFEVFSVSLPGDRIMSGDPVASMRVPAGLAWPESALFGGFKTELFKIRNSDDTVIGVGSRIARSEASGNAFVQWVVHLPARGTVYLSMEPSPAPGQARAGVLSAGTREFASLRGSASETFVRTGAEGGGEEGADNEGRIDLRLTLMAQQDEAE
ncbi:MAG: hypothetical protein OEY72_07845 [Gammaproteobacteria bacterium]|nr:hypothetical protein [Gammaproteobacteria bacterium]